MQPLSSNKCISSSTNVWCLKGMGYSFCGIHDTVVGISIWKKFVLPTFVKDFDVMLSLLFSSKKESLYSASC